MARPAGKTSRSAAKTPAKKRPVPAETHPKPPPKPLLTEVKYLGLAAVGILLLLSVLVEGAAGIAGDFVRQVLVGILGIGAYILPFAIIGAAVYALFSAERRVPRPLVIKTALLCLSLMAILHITTMPPPGGSYNILEYFQILYQEGRTTNGGLLGALLGNLLRSVMNMAGAYIVLIMAALIALVLLTGRSFTNLVTYTIRRVRHYIQGLREEMAEDMEEDFDGYDYEDEYAEPHPTPRSRGKSKPDLIVIENKTPAESKKILLFNEDLSSHTPKPPSDNPIFASRRIKRDSPLETDEKSPPWMEDDQPSEASFPMEEPYASSQHQTEEPDIKVKGLGGPRTPELIFEDEEDDTALAVSSSRQVPLAAFEDYQLPSFSLLTKNTISHTAEDFRIQIKENSRILEETLKSFKVEAKVVEVSVGPTVTRYDMAPGPGVKVATIANLSNDLALSLAAQGIRIEAPVPGKSAVGIEIPNKDPQPVLLREILEDDAFTKFPSRLAFAVGKDITGSPVVTDIARMPHLLIAGATGSGKSVCINTLITSLLYKSRPDEVKLLMIDPKVVELSVYNGIPHLLIPVVTDPKKASGALNWAVNEMENRYALFADAGTRDLKGYNAWLAENYEPELPQIVIIIDELADLMMVAKSDVEESICRLAQKARACGIHLIVATQRPSVDVITGLIKANIPSRLAFAVSSGIDSRTVIDMYGAEKLLGKGDMLFLPMGRSKPLRLQGSFISDKEVEGLVKFLKQQAPAEHTVELIEKVTAPAGMVFNDEDVDEFFHEAVMFLLEKGKASTSMLQRQFRIGYNRASRLMEELESRGIVGPEDGVKPRKVLITREEYITEYQ